MTEPQTIPVLDKGFVRLVDAMGDDRRIVQAARVSYGEGTKTVREDAALIDYLMRHRHTSPFEMVEFTFHVKAPIFVVRQWFRHRTASVNEISARYSVLKDEFYEPAPGELRAQSEVNKQAGEGRLPAAEAERASALLAAAGRDVYARYQELLALGVAREQARSVLPVGIYTEFYWKQDLHNLLHFLRLRLDHHAQAEIRAYARAVAEFVKARVPLVWRSFEEHVLNAHTLSASELEVLRRQTDPYAFATALEGAGLSKSRVREALAKLGFERRTCDECGGSGVVADRWGFWQRAVERGINLDDLDALREIANELGLASDQYRDRDPGWLPPEEETCPTCEGRGYTYVALDPERTG